MCKHLFIILFFIKYRLVNTVKMNLVEFFKYKYALITRMVYIYLHLLKELTF